jgi:hypothetical protein
MGRALALAVIMVLGSLVAAGAQLANGSQSFGGMGSSTPGGDTRPVGTYATPGAERRQSTAPGGAIPMGAATQDTSKLPDDPSNFDPSNAGQGSKSR